MFVFIKKKNKHGQLLVYIRYKFLFPYDDIHSFQSKNSTQLYTLKTLYRYKFLLIILSKRLLPIVLTKIFKGKGHKLKACIHSLTRNKYSWLLAHITCSKCCWVLQGENQFSRAPVPWLLLYPRIKPLLWRSCFSIMHARTLTSHLLLSSKALDELFPGPHLSVLCSLPSWIDLFV